MEVKFDKTDRVLVVAPHQDDETIGCGGLLAKLGKQAEVLLLTDGSLGNVDKETNASKLVNIRNKELKEALKLAKVNKIYSLNVKNEKLKDNKEIVKKFDISKYNYIFVPNRHEGHPDHKVVYSIFKSMKRQQKSNAKIYEYEVWTPLREPTWFLDISDVIDIKKKMIKTYKSQLKGKDYYNATIGLNMYRGLNNNYKYAEAYSYSGYNKFTATIYNLLPEKIKEFIRNKIK